MNFTFCVVVFCRFDPQFFLRVQLHDDDWEFLNVIFITKSRKLPLLVYECV